MKQAYRTFAAVPGLHPLQDAPAQVGGGGPTVASTHVLGRPEGPGLRARSPQPPTPGPAASPEQLSFRERQKYFELEVRVPQAEGPPKRVSLVGADDLRKMQEEEGERPAGGPGRGAGGGGLGPDPPPPPPPPPARKLQQKRVQMLREEAAADAGLPHAAQAPDDEEPEEEPPWAAQSPAAG